MVISIQNISKVSLQIPGRDQDREVAVQEDSLARHGRETEGESGLRGRCGQGPVCRGLVQGPVFP